MLVLPSNLRKEIVDILERENIDFIQYYSQAAEYAKNYEPKEDISNLKIPETDFNKYTDFALLVFFVSSKKRFKDFFEEDIETIFVKENNCYLVNASAFRCLLDEKSNIGLDCAEDVPSLVTSTEYDKYISHKKINQIKKMDFTNAFELSKHQITKLKKMIKEVQESALAIKSFDTKNDNNKNSQIQNKKRFSKFSK